MDDCQRISTVFSWKPEEFDDLVRTCDRDNVTPYILGYLPKQGKNVDVGCGLGRYVRYLADRGYDIEGIEYNEETVRFVNQVAPDLNVSQGDALHLPYAEGTLDGILSLGVVEHFPAGCEEPLRELHRVLKPGGVMVITVPSFNIIRRIKKAFYWHEFNHFLNPVSIAKRSCVIRTFFGKAPLPSRLSYNRRKCGPYEIYPLFGEFFEYRLTKEEFEKALRDTGFLILESVPVAHMDGMFHEFGRIFVSFRNWEFFPSLFGRSLNRLLSKYPFFHNHMHLCVVKKS